MVYFNWWPFPQSQIKKNPITFVIKMLMHFLFLGHVKFLLPATFILPVDQPLKMYFAKCSKMCGCGGILSSSTLCPWPGEAVEGCVVHDFPWKRATLGRKVGFPRLRGTEISHKWREGSRDYLVLVHWCGRCSSLPAAGWVVLPAGLWEWPGEEPAGPWGLAPLSSLCPTELWTEGLESNSAPAWNSDFFFCFQLHSGPLWGLKEKVFWYLAVPLLKLQEDPGVERKELSVFLCLITLRTVFSCGFQRAAALHPLWKRLVDAWAAQTLQDAIAAPRPQPCVTSIWGPGREWRGTRTSQGCVGNCARAGCTLLP